MNERARELARRVVGKRKDELESISLFGEQIDQFAELLIRECAGICDNVGVALWAEQLQSNLGAARTCKEAIEKHFGVE